MHSAKVNIVKAKEDVVCIRQRLEVARSLVVRLEMELDHEETKFVALKSEVGRCSVFHSSVKLWYKGKKTRRRMWLMRSTSGARKPVVALRS
ncbi:hypothetical protein RHMOL_Rhmol09G0131900 [Rhododendron molle]|uniref:Uncharacterized protein n=1 Tax=Rhododendron molle TaxID=49168 RepID=A0ACC0ME09_RHOML|nr:hypothetical protein RHMOL_Rhmol09G0131900 [Rhododendron molle]